jgi:hypothetical protein
VLAFDHQPVEAYTWFTMSRQAAKRVILSPLQSPTLSIEAIREAVWKVAAAREAREAKRAKEKSEGATATRASKPRLTPFDKSV